MTDTPTAPGGEPMRAVVENYGNLPGKAAPMPEDLQPYADRVLKMDMIRDVPGNVKAEGGFRPIKLKATSLPEDQRGPIYRKLENLPKMDAADRAIYEDRFVAEAIRGQLGSIRAKTGLGPDALPYFKEAAEIAGQVNDLIRQRAQYQADYDAIADVRKGTDPETGEVVANPVYRFSPERRASYANTIADIDRRIRLLVGEDGKHGIEGAKRMQAALRQSAELLKRREEERADEAAAQKLAEQTLRDDRIQKRAEAIAKMRTGK